MWHFYVSMWLRQCRGQFTMIVFNVERILFEMKHTNVLCTIEYFPRRVLKIYIKHQNLTKVSMDEINLFMYIFIHQLFEIKNRGLSWVKI